MRRLFTILLLCVVSTASLKHCNDCYARSALKLIKHYRRTNATEYDLMRQSLQTCAGGVPDKILNIYFRNVVVTTASVEKLHRILSKGPAIVGLNSHVFLTRAITDKGLIVDDEQLGNFVKLPDNHWRFEYVCYIRT